MTDWQRTLDVSEAWQQAKNDEIDVQKLAARVADKLEALMPLSDEEIEEDRLSLVSEFRELSESTDFITIEDFDSLWDSLYDWADMSLDSHWNGKKVCWVKTF